MATSVPIDYPFPIRYGWIMSIQNALDFIQQVESRPALKVILRRVVTAQGLSGIVQIGSDRQLIFDERELRSAFAIDWTMRLLHATSRSNR